MNIITSIFTGGSAVVTGFLDLLSDAVTGIGAMFYVAETGLTLLGSLSVIALGVGVVYWAFNLIRGLISRRA